MKTLNTHQQHNHTVVQQQSGRASKKIADGKSG